MIALRAGQRVLLPSGNVVVLLRCERGTWTCEYTILTRQRGLVDFSSAWLHRWGTRV